MSVNPNLESVESFVWWRSVIGFSSKLIYARLVGIELVSSHLEEDKINAFKLLWTANVPNNIQVFFLEIAYEHAPNEGQVCEA